jgi:hypothetical protein
MGITMQNIFNTAPDQPSTALGRIGRDPSRLMTVREWWHEMDEPVEMLADPEASFEEDERALLGLCRENGTNHRGPLGEPREGEGREAAFPAWLLLQFYPLNP